MDRRRRGWSCWMVSGLLGASVAGADPAPAVRAEPLRVGVDANYALDMERTGTVWNWGGPAEELFAGMARHGVGELLVRLCTKDEGAHGFFNDTETTEMYTLSLHDALPIWQAASTRCSRRLEKK